MASRSFRADTKGYVGFRLKPRAPSKPRGRMMRSSGTITGLSGLINTSWPAGTTSIAGMDTGPRVSSNLRSQPTITAALCFPSRRIGRYQPSPRSPIRLARSLIVLTPSALSSAAKVVLNQALTGSLSFGLPSWSAA